MLKKYTCSIFFPPFNLAEACRHHDIEVVKFHLDNTSQNLNKNYIYPMPPGFPAELPLAAAVKADAMECIELLLEHGADPDVRCNHQSNYKTPRELAADKPEILELFNTYKGEKMTELEKILTGKTNINDYNIDIDFDNNEIEELLDNDIIEATDIGISRASDLLIDGVIDYEQYPFENFSAYEQIRQLQYCAIEPSDFRKKVDPDTFDSDDWLYLLEVLPGFAENAPLDELRKNGSVKSWMDLLKSRPEFAGSADWETLAEKGKTEDFFNLAAVVPELYKYFSNKEQLLQADSALWVKLLARRPELADIYPLDTLDEVDEIEFLLLHQPQLVDKISWAPENPPVKLYITNPAPENLAEINPAMEWFITAEISEKLQNILGNILYYNSDDARRQANIIGHNAETFAGIYSRQTAEYIMTEFMKAAAENQLDLLIHKKGE